MRLFDSLSRSDPSPALHEESLFQFLNRVDTPFWDQVRELLDEWFSRLPAESKNEFRSRFRSNARRQTLDAFWELYLHEVFARLGFEVRPHPDVHGSSKKPDFVLSKSGDIVYLEATTVSEMEGEKKRERRLAQVYDAINAMPSPNFVLSMEVLREGLSTPSIRKLTKDLSDWLLSLDPDDGPVLGSDVVAEPYANYEWQDSDWCFGFRAIPKDMESRSKPGGRTIGLYPGYGGVVDDAIVIRESLRGKADRYGQLDQPYIIALHSLRTTTDDNQMQLALFGPALEHPAVLQAGEVPRSWPLAREGLWVTRAGSWHANVSAVLTAPHLRPWNVTEAELCIYHNPWARYPLAVTLPCRHVRLDPVSGSLVSTPAETPPWSVLGLPRDWPRGEPFPHERE